MVSCCNTDIVRIKEGGDELTKGVGRQTKGREYKVHCHGANTKQVRAYLAPACLVDLTSIFTLTHQNSYKKARQPSNTTCSRFSLTVDTEILALISSDHVSVNHIPQSACG